MENSQLEPEFDAGSINYHPHLQDEHVRSGEYSSDKRDNRHGRPFRSFIQDLDNYPLLSENEQKESISFLRTRENFVRFYLEKKKTGEAVDPLALGINDPAEFQEVLKLYKILNKKYPHELKKLSTKKIVAPDNQKRKDKQPENQKKKKTEDPFVEAMIDELLKYDNKYQKIKNEFELSHQRLGIFFAKKYVWTKLPLIDLIQEASFGIKRATRKFDPTKGVKFSTYADDWIKLFIDLYVMDERTINIPKWLQVALKRMDKIHLKFMNEYGRKANFEELLKETKLTKITLKNVLEFEEQLPTVSHSLDHHSQLGEESLKGGSQKPEERLYEFLKDNLIPNPEAQIIAKQTADKIHAALRKLNSNDRILIKSLYWDQLTEQEIVRLLKIKKKKYWTCKDAVEDALVPTLTRLKNVLAENDGAN